MHEHFIIATDPTIDITLKQSDISRSHCARLTFILIQNDKLIPFYGL